MTVTAYRPRPIRSQGLRSIGDWRIKVYTIALPGQEARTDLVAATLDKAASVLPTDAFAEGRHGAGFVIAHDAAGVCFGLVYWWQGENELHQRLFMAETATPGALSPIENPAAGCVWELEVIDFERRAWLADVLANPAGPDVELYLSRLLDTDI